jgi:hypothetical protein
MPRRRRRKPNPVHEKLLRQARKRYEEFVLIQGGEACAICGAGRGQRRLHIDHDHGTMALRGLLCFPCNVLIRKRWTVEMLRAAADYLESPPLRGLDEDS